MWSAIIHNTNKNTDNIKKPNETNTMFTCNICNLQVLMKNKDKHLLSKKHIAKASSSQGK